MYVFMSFFFKYVWACILMCMLWKPELGSGVSLHCSSTEADLSIKHRTEDVANLGIVLGIPSLPSEAGTTSKPRCTPSIAVCHEDTNPGPQACGNPFNH